MKTEPNEPINTVHYVTKGREDKYGLTKREYFAAMSMQGILSNGSCTHTYEEDAETAVRVSDYLITALNKGGAK